ncbi:MAG: PrsW family glutamic-type intramembrane protease [Lutibacter sp.]|uniref:PrsW family intramembrane metalloprotease n=1 Tax=Lutibacter sp. TaxID=1925666 RepID=UPI00299D9F4E|nr:PrsW family glutamic-type intramembrane protease [Lutibacter sp.]MDX1828291.1 PrsW family glutamic-type intramembrane protease [Lutibacter sp.]
MNLFLSATAPVITVIIYIYIKDRFEKEPKLLLLYNFLFGAIASILISSILYFLYDILLPHPDRLNVFHQFLKAFFMVGLVEEFSKYIIVRYYAQPKKAFNEPFDGIIYAVMVSMGFAFVENLLYVFDGGIQVALIRAVTAVPAHAVFAIIMGYFMGIAKFSNHKIKWNLIGLGLAIIFHGAYDFFLFINFIPGISLGAFVSLIIGIILAKRAIKTHQNNSIFK